MIDWITWLKSKTFWGVFITIFGVVSDPSVLAFFPANISHVIGVIGVALVALGLKSAIATGPQINGVPIHAEIAAAKEAKKNS